MKKLYFLMVLAAIVAACSSPQNLIKNENYDLAVEKLSRKLRTGKIRTKDVDALKTAYHAANQIDHDRIQLLQLDGNDENWTEIFDLYNRMIVRQDKVRFLNEDIRQAINFQYINYNNFAAEARKKAVNSLVGKVNALLATDSKSDARMALNHLHELERIFPDMEGLSQLKNKAILQATNYVLVQFDNQSGINVPDEFINTMMAFSASDFEESLLSYDFAEQRNVDYDYLIFLTLKQIVVSPERVDSRSFVEKKEIQDGMQPKRDADGKIMLDSTGKVLEEPRLRTVEAYVNETVLLKDVLLRASVDYYDNVQKKNVHSAPVEQGVSFVHSYAVVNGDLRACTKETMEMMKRTAVPFPPDAAMVMDAASLLHQDIKKVILRDAGIVKRTSE